MKGEGDVFKRFRNDFNKLDGHFHILEQRVPVDLQMEYFRYSENILKEKGKPFLRDQDFIAIHKGLSDPEATTDDKKYILSILAISADVKAYRVLEDYVQHPDDDVIEWAYMALMESRISLESELLQEKQIYISTGLGGKGEKLRFYVLMLAKNRMPFLDYQREVIEREFAYCLSKANCIIERLTIGEQFVEMVFLISVRADIKATIDVVINECNQYGDFLSNAFTLTNVKELTPQEVADIINKNENNKASY